MDRFLIFVDGFVAYSFLGGTPYCWVECEERVLDSLLTNVFGFLSKYYIVCRGRDMVDQLITDTMGKGLAVSDLRLLVNQVRESLI